MHTLQNGHEIEKLVGKRRRKYGRGKLITEYLVRWKGYGPEDDTWYGEDLLDQTVDLRKEYDQIHKAPHT